MKIVTAAEMREIDRATSERFGVPSLTLMENAGGAVTHFALERYPDAKRIVVVCGKGNNGGDGFVAARKLREAGREVQVLLLADPSELRGDAAEMFSKLPIRPTIARSGDDVSSSIAEADLMVDAILGTGFRPPVTGLYADTIVALNKSTAPILAIDIPSGADADAMTKPSATIVDADAIVTFTAPRPAHVFGSLMGPTSRKPRGMAHPIIAPIGSPNEAITSSLNLNLITAKDIASLFAPRPADSNKGLYGHVLVIGGSLGKAGAAAMAGMSALRAGAGLSTVATAKSVLPTVAGFHPELMTEVLDETEAGTISGYAQGVLDALVEKKTVLAIGPGISRHPETSAMVRESVRKYQMPIVLDADGLNAFEGYTKELNGKGRTLVITPHPGEMARLINGSIADVQNDRLGVARKFAREHELIVVLKGHRTLIAKPDGEVWVNTTGNPGMATGGTGDILTGMVAGLIAQHPKDAFRAVVAAVHMHGLAGDVANESLGEHSLVATDLIGALPEAFRRIHMGTQTPEISL